MNSLVEKLIIGAFLIFAPWLMSSTAWAATYYVDKHHPSASDSNPGTESQPWESIQHAVDSVGPGNNVYIKGAVYSERVMLTGTNGVEGQSGTEEDGYITYEGYPGDNVILDGSEFSGWGSAFTSGKWAPGSRAMNFISIKNLTIKNYPEHGISFESDSEDPAAGRGSHHILIENATVYSNGSIGIHFEGGAVQAAHDIEVKNCTVHNNSNHGIKFTGDSAGVTDREHLHTSLIENCASFENKYVGIYVSTGHSNITIRNNASYNNGRQGIAAHEIWDSVYENNNVYLNGKNDDGELEGIAIWNSRNLTIRGNIIHDNPGAGLKLYKGLNGSSHIVENNLIFNNNGGVSISTDVNNSSVYHNTIAENQRLGLYISDTSSGNIIKNNIFYKNSSQVTPGSGNTFDYNLYFPDVSFTGKGPNAISNDPSFFDPVNKDFHLMSTSSAKDSGAAVGIDVDHDGNQRPAGSGFDIGCYEYVSTLATVPPSGLKIVQ